VFGSAEEFEALPPVTKKQMRHMKVCKYLKMPTVISLSSSHVLIKCIIIKAQS